MLTDHNDEDRVSQRGKHLGAHLGTLFQVYHQTLQDHIEAAGSFARFDQADRGLVKDPAVLKAVQRGHDFFLENLIIGRRVPRFRQDRKYPVDIHACSEAILCLTELSEDFPEGLDVACAIASWTVDNMSDYHGQFYYRKYPLYTIKE